MHKKNLYILYSTLVMLLLAGCGTKNTSVDELNLHSTDVTDESIKISKDVTDESIKISKDKSLIFSIPEKWIKLDSILENSISLSNEDFSSTILINVSDRLDSGNLSIDEHLNSLNEIYKDNQVFKILESGIEDIEANIGYVYIERKVETSTVRELEIHLLVDDKILLISGQNLDGSDPSTLKDDLLQIAKTTHSGY